MAEEPHYGQRYPRILMEASTGNQEIGSKLILRCGKELEATTLSPKRAADDSGRLLSPTLIEEGRLVSEWVNTACYTVAHGHSRLSKLVPIESQ